MGDILKSSVEMRETFMSELCFKDECYAIIGACMEVHNTLGHGFLEPVYQAALAIELSALGIDYVKEAQLNISYKGEILPGKYFADFICYDEIIIELKALSALTSDHDAQLLNYLKATGKKLGLLVNFGTPRLTHRRLVL